MPDNDEVNQLRSEIRDSLTQLGSGISEIRAALTAFIERITRLEENSKRIPQIEKRVDDLDKKLEPIRDEVVSATNAARWANKLAKWIMPSVFTGAAAIGAMYIRDHINQQLQPVVAEMHDIQSKQQSQINELDIQVRSAQQQQRSTDVNGRRDRY
ncbi:hypothetical phage membrane protein [Burkholderia multivorans]|uniref:Uncharacterized protein n=1 Tax=Burkholderia multivorans TaxID=87883 RepID=A0AAP2MNW7_9BURK|nr:hypothetical protein [Burkholderia multivorans]MBU9357511.1 hypothetical protein [Burkholderia multivorans]MBU9366561.1 hypothetical protein [Burkholderia multivorans]MBU9523605.1 hypothetical protein [Burkholderia multivorans]MBU9690554.1 hypothetical protein [Burkholderia multivorans]CAB5280795.1 hypothetical phage membrane protein [Burkholderia multivorans]